MRDQFYQPFDAAQVRRVAAQRGADELATMRGMLAGIAKFEDLYCAAMRQQGRLRNAE